MESSLQIRRINEIPSPEEFASQIERKNVPAVITSFSRSRAHAHYKLIVTRISRDFSSFLVCVFDDNVLNWKVFSGCAKEWKAFSRWNVSNGGLDYLQVIVWTSLKRNVS